MLFRSFRKKKIVKIEALYQVLGVAQEAEVDEQIRQAAIDDYTTQIDLIDAQQRSTEQQGEHTAQLAGIGDERGDGADPDRCESHREETRRDGSDDEVGRFL